MKANKIFRVLILFLLFCLLLVTIPATPAKAVASINISPSSGPVGTMVIITAKGFTPDTTYTIKFAGVGISIGDTDTGNFTAYFTVPLYPRGTHAITITTASETSDPVYYSITSIISLSALSGYVGDVVTATGTGFRASSTVTIYFGTTAAKTVTTTSSGTFSNVNLSIPDISGGSHLVKGTDASGESPAVNFLIMPKTAISPSSGAVGGQVTINGSGFHANSVVTIYFDDESIKTAQTSNKGALSNVIFNVPESYQGSHTIKAQDSSGSYATASFSVSPTVTISSASGAPNTKVIVSGNGFRPSSAIIISFDDVSVVTTPTPVASSSKGSFSAEFIIPPSSGGTHQIKISDGFNIDVKPFSILSSLTIEPLSGFVGSEINISGSGFQASQSVTITFHNKTVETTTTDSYGRFNVSFNVPAYPGGTYKITVSDGVNVQEISYNITTAVNISETTGHVGTSLTVTGVGFTSSRTVNITYDGNQMATTTVNVNGSFSTSFDVPASSKGEHIITATDGINSLQSTFTMESTPPAIPVPLKPEMNIKAKSQAYFDWEDVTDPSGVTYTLQIATRQDFSRDFMVLEKTGIEQSEYTITKEERLKTVKKDAPYYWHVKAVDGASNESNWSGAGSFYVGFSLSLPQPVIYVLIGVGALALAVFSFWLGRRTAYYS